MPRTYKLLEVKDLNTSFKIDAGRVLAVNGVSFELEKGKVLGIVGESGSGKSVTAYSIMQILDKNGKVDSGKILYNGTDLLKLNNKQMRDIRGNKISIIFQDAMVSLNPTWSIGNQLREAILVHSGDPIKEKISPIENEIISDTQRIESMERGLANHPDREELRSDLEFVRKKLIEDQEKLKTVTAQAKKDLKANEKAAMAEYKANVGPYKEAYKNAKKEYTSKYKELNPEPTQEIISSHKTYKANEANILALKEVYDKAQAIFNEKQNNKTKKALKIAKRDYDQAVKEQEKYVSKVKKRYILEPRKARKKALLETKKALNDYYWSQKSKYRETKWSANKRALEMLVEVGITEPEKRLKQYPFELSGGMLQRCMIAMALVQKPDILIADEPTTALDVTIQAQILELLKKLQVEYGMGVIIITHDLGVVAQVCDEVDIMYAGRIVERGTVEDIFYNPQHEYTKGLLNSMPKLDQPKGLLDPIQGNPVDLFCLPKGCAFSARCKNCMEICIDKYPEEIEVDNATGHRCSCWKVVKTLHEKGLIDVTGEPTGKPLVYNGAIISNLKKKDKKNKVEETKDEDSVSLTKTETAVSIPVEENKEEPVSEVKEEVKKPVANKKPAAKVSNTKGKKNGNKK